MVQLSRLRRAAVGNVPHIKQLHSWDCGLACVLMALNTIGINDCSIEGLAYLCRTNSGLVKSYSVDRSFRVSATGNSGHDFKMELITTYTFSGGKLLLDPFNFFPKPGSSLPFRGNLVLFLPLNMIIAVIPGNYLITTARTLTAFGQHFPKMEIAAPILYLDVKQKRRSNDPLMLIWTVDLAYLLQMYSVSFSYYTVTLGANPNYSVETFYKEQLPTDLVRVDMLFKKAREEGINIQCRSINEKEISLFILSGKYIAIALVNQYKLSHSWLENVVLPSLNGGNSGYAGHYIVICGYDAGTDEFEIRDPATSSKHERISSKCLEEARKSFGTDEDFLLVPKTA
ncbi:unnamed protein product [Dovyalis caffra]|uniref:Guanylyl cyclase n=1 Tax=Dovyalis caffra TaxID=77055 RepID=A0AAV1R0I5_9ROSI|nr:unnamed protein product [Dovyalis caffra]